MNERAARAYLSHITEPCNQLVGRMVAELGAEETLSQLRTDPDMKDQYPPRMNLGDDQAVTDWLQATQHRHQVTFLTPLDADWPKALNDLGDTAPYGLWVRGNLAALDLLSRSVSAGIVGARAATSYGEHVAQEITADLARNKIVIVSGMAYGIDGAAHRTALAAGGTTIAFVAGGVDRAYPAGHQELSNRIMAQGAMIAEVPPQSAPTKWRFLARNRLIAAASNAVVVVEAGWRSGSLNTAMHATSLRRPLGAVPGPVTSPASAGCHRIIQDGTAKLVTCAEDVLTLMQHPTPTPLIEMEDQL